MSEYTIPQPTNFPNASQETIMLLEAIAGLHERLEALEGGGE